MQIQVIEAVGEERLTVHRFWQLFQHDVSEFTGDDADAEPSAGHRTQTFHIRPAMDRV